ncbi:hypothetical protein CHISP_1925 [Chitinispirillum alkaliphilum]|nr:hypothetical protein CHISP_1925 [Chitinispirillum alkaliphilum]
MLSTGNIPQICTRAREADPSVYIIDEETELTWYMGTKFEFSSGVSLNVWCKRSGFKLHGCELKNSLVVILFQSRFFSPTLKITGCYF